MQSKQNYFLENQSIFKLMNINIFTSELISPGVL